MFENSVNSIMGAKYVYLYYFYGFPFNDSIVLLQQVIFCSRLVYMTVYRNASIPKQHI